MADRVAILTTGRQDYGILRSTVHALAADPAFDLRLWVGGMHLSQVHGHTVDHLLADGVEVHQRLPFLRGEPAADSAAALEAVAAALAAERPAALLLVGDRSETLAAGFAAVLAQVPIVHLHGGEETEGAVDNAFRHALTKLSALHLVSHDDHAARVIQMGEDPANVVVVGAPGLDNLYRDDLPDRTGLEARIGRPLAAPVVVVTVHPTTLLSDPLTEVRAIAAALEPIRGTIVVTLPNADAGGEAIRGYWRSWAEGRAGVALVDALGEAGYLGLLRIADAVVGNSSSGIIEAPSAGVPAVNVGDRQAGRLRAASVVDVSAEAAAVREALRQALSPGAKEAVRATPALYPRGPAAPRIVTALRSWLPRRSTRKRFHRVVA